MRPHHVFWGEYLLKFFWILNGTIYVLMNIKGTVRCSAMKEKAMRKGKSQLVKGGDLDGLTTKSTKNAEKRR